MTSHIDHALITNTAIEMVWTKSTNALLRRLSKQQPQPRDAYRQVSLRRYVITILERKQQACRKASKCLRSNTREMISRAAIGPKFLKESQTGANVSSARYRQGPSSTWGDSSSHAKTFGCLWGISM